MNRRKLLTAGGATAVDAAAGPATSLVKGGDQGIVGSYFGTITATNPPLPG
jgi:hypothetical protein